MIPFWLGATLVPLAFALVLAFFLAAILSGNVWFMACAAGALLVGCVLETATEE